MHLRDIGAEAHSALVIDQRVACHDVTPSKGRRAHAKIGLLAITLAEGFDIEITNFVETIAPDIHTKTDRRRNFHGPFKIPRAAGGV